MQVVGILLEWMEWGVSSWIFGRAQEPDLQGFILGSALDSKIGHHFKVLADRAERQRELCRDEQTLRISRARWNPILSIRGLLGLGVGPAHSVML